MKDVCIVIPYYKEQLDENEMTSYSRVLSVLSGYDIAVAAPEKIRASLDIIGAITVYLPDDRFVSRLSYSQMMLDPSFYELFAEYEYILLYQLDAYVFSDRLIEFCDMGYDYIGAPLPKFEWFDLYHNLSIKESYSVGNGGFSLRKVESCIRVLKKKQEIYDRSGLGDVFDRSEDEFWGYCGRCDDIDFIVPNIDTANNFATWGYEKELFDKYPDELPFGVHGWYTAPWKNVWMPFVNRTRPTNDEIRVFNEYVLRRKIEYLIKHINSFDNNGMTGLTNAFCSLVPDNRDIVLWGSGKYGDLIRKLLSIGNRKIKCIYDSNPKTKEIEGIPVLKSSKCISHTNEMIVISSLFHEDSIEECIKDIVDIRDCDYLMCSKLLQEALEDYYGEDIETAYEKV